MNFNPKKYGKLLVSVLPTVIETDEDYQRLDEVLSELLAKCDKLSPEEDKLLNLVAQLIENYEDRAYPIAKGEPVEMLKFLLTENNLKQKDLLPIFGSEGIISEILKGKRAITAKHAKMLAERFKVSTDLFL